MCKRTHTTLSKKAWYGNARRRRALRQNFHFFSDFRRLAAAASRTNFFIFFQIFADLRQPQVGPNCSFFADLRQPQVVPKRDLRQFHTRVNESFHTYEWVMNGSCQFCRRSANCSNVSPNLIQRVYSSANPMWHTHRHRHTQTHTHMCVCVRVRVYVK